MRRDRPNTKMGNRKTNGYDSGHEANQAASLHALARAGNISDLKEQVTFVLIPKIGKQLPCTYKADFTWIEDGKFVVADAKGFKTEVYRIKKKLMKFVHDIEIREI